MPPAPLPPAARVATADRRALTTIATILLALLALDAALILRRHLGDAASDLALRLATLASLAASAAALVLAVRRTRARAFTTDALFPLILLAPPLAVPPAALDRTALGAALLGLLAAAIVGIRRESVFRYIAAGALALLLPLLSTTFLMMIPPLILWLGAAGFAQAQAREPALRPRGFVILAIAGAGLFLFLLAALLEPPTPTPEPATLFATIVSFADFPLAVAGIMALALAWGRSPRGGNPPYIAGMLALLLGFLTLLLHNFQPRTLPPPGADQTLVLMCVVYAVFALAAPPVLRWTIALLLLAAATTYLVLRPM